MSLRAKPLDIREQYGKQLKDLQEAYGEAMLELRARKNTMPCWNEPLERHWSEPNGECGRQMIQSIPQGLLAARWRQVCIRAGVVRSTAWRRWVAALLTISKKLEKLDKSKGKGKGAKSLTATTRTTPRESGAGTSDNRPDPSNFGRDTFPGFDA